MTTPSQFAHSRRRRRLGLAMPVVLAVVVALATYIAARTSSDERVAQMWVAATVAHDGSAEIVEVIDYDFGANSRHGIFRDIPDLRASEPVRVSSPDAPDAVTVERSSFFDPQVRIGDPDETVTGQHRYVLRYTLDGVAQDGQIAWDAVGTAWDVPIEDVEVHVVAPATLDDPTCSTGATGSRDPCTESGDDPGHVVATVAHLDPGEGITVSATVGAPLDAAPPLPDPPDPPDALGVSTLGLAGLAALVALLAGLGAKWWIRRADRHHAPRLGLPGMAPGEKSRVDPADLPGYAVTSSRLPDGITPAQGGVLLSGYVHSWGMAAWLAEQAAAGTIDFEPSETGKDGTGKSGTGKSGVGKGDAVVIVRRQPGDEFIDAVLDRAFGNRERLTLGTYDSRFAQASKRVEDQLRRWRETSGFWDRAARRRARWAKRLGLAAGLIGLVLVIVGGTKATTAGTAAITMTALGAALTSAGCCLALSFWGSGVLTPEGSAAWLQVESLRLFLTQSLAAVDDDDVPTARLGEYTAWAVALHATEAWSRIASRVAETTRQPVDAQAPDTTFVDSTYWIRHATLAGTLVTSCHASSYLPSVSTASSSGSSGGSSYSSSSSSVGSGSGGGGGGSW